MQQSNWPPPPPQVPPQQGYGGPYGGTPHAQQWHPPPAYYPAHTYAKKGMSPALVVVLVIAVFFLGTCGVGLIAGLASLDGEASTQTADATSTVPVDEWLNLSLLEAGTPPKPVAYRPSKKLRLVIFGASWCPGCNSGAPVYASFAERFRGKAEVAVALRESDADFTKSKMSRWLTGVPVWNEASTEQLKDECGVFSLPSACLVAEGEVLWSGGADDSAAIVAAHLDDNLDKVMLKMTSLADYDGALTPDARQRVAEAYRGFASIENEIAWEIADDVLASDEELALAVALSRDATIVTGGVDFALLDTYGLALSKSGRDKDAAIVGERVIEVCNVLGASCSEERARAQDLIFAAD